MNRIEREARFLVKRNKKRWNRAFRRANRQAIIGGKASYERNKWDMRLHTAA